MLTVDSDDRMGRTATNALGNAAAYAAIAKWEGALASSLDEKALPGLCGLRDADSSALD